MAASLQPPNKCWLVQLNHRPNGETNQTWELIEMMIDVYRLRSPFFSVGQLDHPIFFTASSPIILNLFNPQVVFLLSFFWWFLWPPFLLLKSPKLVGFAVSFFCRWSRAGTNQRMTWREVPAMSQPTGEASWAWHGNLWVFLSKKWDMLGLYYCPV